MTSVERGRRCRTRKTLSASAFVRRSMSSGHCAISTPPARPSALSPSKPRVGTLLEASDGRDEAS